MHKQVCVHIPQTVKFVSKFSRKPLSGISDQRAPSPPPNEKLQIWDDQSLLRNTPQWKTSDLRWPKFTPEYPPHEKLQIWDDQSLLWNTPLPKMKTFRFEMTKVYSGIPPPPMKNLDLRWPKFTLEYPPAPSPNEKLGRSYVETKSLSPVDTISLCLQFVLLF